MRGGEKEGGINPIFSRKRGIRMSGGLFLESESLFLFFSQRALPCSSRLRSRVEEGFERLR